MRTSSYVIYVDLPDTGDEILLIHGYTGAYDLVGRHLVPLGAGLSVGPRCRSPTGRRRFL